MLIFFNWWAGTWKRPLQVHCRSSKDVSVTGSYQDGSRLWLQGKQSNTRWSCSQTPGVPSPILWNWMMAPSVIPFLSPIQILHESYGFIFLESRSIKYLIKLFYEHLPLNYRCLLHSYHLHPPPSCAPNSVQIPSGDHSHILWQITMKIPVTFTRICTW